MKGTKKILTFVLALAMVVTLFEGISIKSQAAEHLTYYVRYIPATGGYRMMTTEFGATDIGSPLSYLERDIRDGDDIVVYGNDAIKADINCGDTKLGTVIYIGGGFTLLKAASVENIHCLKNTTSATSAYVKNAYVYDNAIAQFHSDVETLYIANESSNSQRVGVAGAVKNFFQVSTSDMSKIEIAFYDIPEGKLVVNNGGLYTDPKDRSTTPSATQTPVTPEQNTNKDNQKTTDSDLDAVPKTGDTTANISVYLLAAALACFGSAVVFRKKENR